MEKLDHRLKYRLCPLCDDLVALRWNTDTSLYLVYEPNLATLHRHFQVGLKHKPGPAWLHPLTE